MSFLPEDLVGVWVGTIKKGEEGFNLELSVAHTGEVTGSGVSSLWRISETGKVEGAGSFSFVCGSKIKVAAARWSLLLNNEKNTLCGIFNVRFTGMGDMQVTLQKKEEKHNNHFS